MYIETASSIELNLGRTYAREGCVGSSLAVAENERHRGTGAPHNTTRPRNLPGQWSLTCHSISMADWQFSWGKRSIFTRSKTADMDWALLHAWSCNILFLQMAEGNHSKIMYVWLNPAWMFNDWLRSEYSFRVHVPFLDAVAKACQSQARSTVSR